MGFSLVNTFNANPVKFSDELHQELLVTRDVCVQKKQHQSALHFVSSVTGDLTLEIAVQYMPGKKLCDSQLIKTDVPALLSFKFGLGNNITKFFDVIIKNIKDVFDVKFDQVVIRVELDSVLVATGSYMFLFMRHGSERLN